MKLAKLPGCVPGTLSTAQIPRGARPVIPLIAIVARSKFSTCDTAHPALGAQFQSFKALTHRSVSKVSREQARSCPVSQRTERSKEQNTGQLHAGSGNQGMERERELPGAVRDHPHGTFTCPTPNPAPSRSHRRNHGAAV